MKCRTALTVLFTGCVASAQAQVNADDFLGYWTTAQRDGIVQLTRCPLFKNAPPTGLCGTIVWDAEVNNPKRTQPLDCNRKVFEAAKFDGNSWKDGWAYDTRSRKFHSTRLRLKDGALHVRAFVGTEVNGITEIFTRVEEVPKGCEQRSAEPASVKGIGR